MLIELCRGHYYYAFNLSKHIILTAEEDRRTPRLSARLTLLFHRIII